MRLNPVVGEAYDPTQLPPTFAEMALPDDYAEKLIAYTMHYANEAVHVLNPDDLHASAELAVGVAQTDPTVYRLASGGLRYALDNYTPRVKIDETDETISFAPMQTLNCLRPELAQLQVVPLIADTFPRVAYTVADRYRWGLLSWGWDYALSKTPQDQRQIVFETLHAAWSSLIGQEAELDKFTQQYPTPKQQLQELMSEFGLPAPTQAQEQAKRPPKLSDTAEPAVSARAQEFAAAGEIGLLRQYLESERSDPLTRTFAAPKLYAQAFDAIWRGVQNNRLRVDPRWRLALVNLVMPIEEVAAEPDPVIPGESQPRRLFRR